LRFTSHNENRLRVGGKEWIEIYESQRKWTRSRNFKKATGEADHPSHRTFEVLRFSGPLKSAELNLQFLPLLTKRAKDPAAMKIALSRLLEEVPPQPPPSSTDSFLNSLPARPPHSSTASFVNCLPSQTVSRLDRLHVPLHPTEMLA